MTTGPFTARRILALLLVGVLGGLLSGVFGVGGGTIMVPLLIRLLGFDQRRAAATSLAAIVPTAVAGALGYLGGGQLDLLAAALIALGGVAGALVGTRLLRTLPLGWLRWMFVGLLLLVAIRMLFVVPVRGASVELGPWVIAALVLLGLVVGVASGMFGIGGGVVIVPVLVAFLGVSDLVAKGTSLVAMIPMSVSGTVANRRAGMVRVADGLVIGVAAAAAGLGGVALAFVLPPRLSAVLFGLLMLVVAAEVTYRALRARRKG